jgi:hypothetical protein
VVPLIGQHALFDEPQRRSQDENSENSHPELEARGRWIALG